MCSSTPPTVPSLLLPSRKLQLTLPVTSQGLKSFPATLPLLLFTGSGFKTFTMSEYIEIHTKNEETGVLWAQCFFKMHLIHFRKRVRWQKKEGPGFHSISATQKLSGLRQIINYNSLKISILQGCHEDWKIWKT